MIASAPSKTAIDTSETSARVGTGAVIIDSSIWVATTTGLPARRAARVICFWMPGTASSGISTPRSPRATISASESSMISASRATACGFSIFDIKQRPAARDLARLGEIVGTLDEGQRHPVDAGLEHRVEVGAVLLGQRADRQLGVGQADALLVGDRWCRRPPWQTIDLPSQVTAFSSSLPSSISSRWPASTERQDFRMRQVDAR